MKRLSFFITLFCISCLFADKIDQKKEVSKAMGHLIKENLDQLNIPVDLDLLIEGIKDAQKGLSSPLDEEKCFQLIEQMQQIKNEKQAEKNLKEAEEFLAKLSQKKPIRSLENNLIFYQITQEGKGAALKQYHNPLLSYVGKYLDGTEIGASLEGERVDLQQTIPGFTKAILGMKEGESRTIYIHPSLAHGNSTLFRPNALIIFEVTLHQVDCTAQLPSEIAEEKATF